MKFNKLFIIAILTLCFSNLYSQTNHDASMTRDFYFGVKGGIPLSSSTFTGYNFKATPEFGMNGGLFFGYNFNPMISIEAFGSIGNTVLGRHSTCHYWLDPNGVKYDYNMPGSIAYKDLFIDTKFTNLGLKVNFDVLQMVSKDETRKLSLAVSPMVGYYGTTTSINKLADNSTYISSDMVNGFGGGGEIALGYKFSSVFGAQIYSNIAFLNQRIDNIANPEHNGNFIHDRKEDMGKE